VPSVALHGPGAAAYAYAVASVLLAVVIAWRPLPVPRVVGPLRRLHSGHPGEYVAWTVAGAAVLVVALGVGR
jgi:multicomponent Na+:H+ antiporter subunit D